MDKFYEALKDVANMTTTQKGMPALISTGSSILDIFAQVETFRNLDYKSFEEAIIKAFNEDKDLTLKLVFYLRNCRSLGQGERKVFRHAIHILARLYSDAMRKNLEYVPLFGRYDDLYAFVSTPLEKDAFNILKQEAFADLNRDNPSLVGKWLKSVNASDSDSRFLARLTAQHFGLSLKEYRKMCSCLREKLALVENTLRTKNYACIDYDKIPGQAFLKYKEAFLRNDEVKYRTFLEKLKKGYTKINTNTIYPYQIIQKYLQSNKDANPINETLEAMWKNLPKYVSGSHNVLVVVDTSASMMGLPYNMAVSLAIYLANHNEGIWHNKFITFSERPRFVELKGSTLYENLNSFTPLYANTNIEAVFDLILASAISHDLKDEDMVKQIIIVSDMQFDDAISTRLKNRPYTDIVREKFKQASLTMPELVYWNVSGNFKDTFHTSKYAQNAKLVSGSSPSIFMEVLTSDFKEPYSFMLEILNNDLFKDIKA